MLGAANTIYWAIYSQYHHQTRSKHLFIACGKM